MATTVTLSAIKAGITRLRTKGGASEDSLYDLANAYVTAARTIRPRPGSARHASLPTGTIGLALFNGVFQVFSDRGMTGLPANFNLNVLNHPNRSQSSPQTLVRIWKAEPFMGGMYVVAQWSDNAPGEGYHYWIQSVGAGSWKANALHKIDDRATPVVANGLTYEAHRLVPLAPVWSSGAERTVGDVVEPTVYNGFQYEVVETHGSPARSGASEPRWVAREGAIITETADIAPPAPPPSTTVPPPGTPPGYQNPGGGGGGGYQTPQPPGPIYDELPV